MTIILKLLLLVLLTTISRVSYGQKVEFEHLLNSHGLISSKVTTILKDYQGYMWFGTYEGLSRYDGYSFTNFLNDPKDSTSLSDNYIRCMYETKDSIMLLGFQAQGLAIYDRKTESFLRYKHDDKDPHSLVHDFVFTIFEDSKGNIWIGTRGGLDKFDPKTKKFYHYKPFPDEEFAVTAIDEDNQNMLWLYGKGKELCHFNPDQGTFEYRDFMPANLKTKRFYFGGVIKHDSKNNIWIGDNAGVFRYNPTSGELVAYNVENKKLHGNLVLDIIEDSQKNIWIGCDGGGLYKYNYKNDSLEVFLHDESTPSSLSGNGVYCIYESDPGIIWVGVYSGGVNIYKKDKKKFTTYTTRGKVKEVLNNKSVFGIAEIGKGKIWLGTDGGGINVFDSKLHTFSYLTKENSLVHSDIIKCIVPDKKGNIWLGSYGAGVAKVNFNTQHREIYSVGNDQKKNIFLEHVWSLCSSSDSNMYIGLLSYGLQIYDNDKDLFTYHPIDTTSVNKSSCNINVITEDHNKNIWIGSFESGLICMDPKTKTLTHFVHDPDRPSSLKDNCISDILEDSKHNIWIATNFGGLNKLIDYNTKTFKNYTKADGLPSNAIRSILEDDKGNLWLSTDNGISLFKVSENKFINFSTEDGIVNPDFNLNSKLKDHNGHFYFGGIDGLSRFHPDSINFNHHKPKVVLTDFKIFNESIKPFKEYGKKIYLKNSLSLTNEITLTPDDNIFSIDFAALDYMSPNDNQYAYKLIGFNDRWTKVSANKRFATYTNLDPGEYTFSVIASNNDGFWNKEGALLKITILPPWWETLGFRIGATLALLTLLTGYYYFRLKAIEQRNSDLRIEVQKRTLELKTANEGLVFQKEEIEAKNDLLEKNKLELEYSNKTKDKFFSIIGHDLKGPVTALTTLTSLLKSDWVSLEEYPCIKSPEVGLPEDLRSLMMRVNESINHIDKSSFQIKSLVLNLLEWARTQSGQVKMNLKSIPVNELIKGTVALLDEQACQKDIIIQCEIPQQHTIKGDFNMLSTIVRNILSNSIKYTPKGGRIFITSSLINEKNIQIEIKDSGIGMTEEILGKLFSIDKGPSEKGTEKETGTGLGLVISQEFAHLHNGEIYAQSVRGKGSSFYIILPVFV